MFEVWLVIFIILLVIEIATVNLVTVWFAVGAIVASIVSLFVDNTMIQLAVFVISSAVSLVVSQPLLKKYRNKNTVRTNLDRIIGEIGIVTEEIGELEPGEVKVDGKRWSAVSKNPIKVGRKVEILSIDGVKLHVKEVKKKEEEV